MGIALGILFIVVVFILPSIRMIGATEVGLVTKRFGLKKLTGDNPIAFHGEAGYQADLLMPGWRLKFWIVYRVEKFPWVQVPAGEIGVVIAQVGAAAAHRRQVRRVQKGIRQLQPICADFIDQRRPEGRAAAGALSGHAGADPSRRLSSSSPSAQVFGVPDLAGNSADARRQGRLSSESFGLKPGAAWSCCASQPQPVGRAARSPTRSASSPPLKASRCPRATSPAGWEVSRTSRAGKQPDTGDAQLIETLLGSKNNAAQQLPGLPGFLDNGGKIGLQHDPLLYGAYNLNPFLVRSRWCPCWSSSRARWR